MYGFHSVEQEIGTRQRISQALRNFKTLLDVAVYFKHHHILLQQLEMFQRRVTVWSLLFLGKCFDQQLWLLYLLTTYWYYWSKHTKSSVSKLKKKTQATPYFTQTVQHVKSPQWFQTVIKKNMESEEKSTLQQLSHWVLQAYMLTYLLQVRVIRTEYLIINLICQQCVCFHVFYWFRDWKHFPVETYNTE